MTGKSDVFVGYSLTSYLNPAGIPFTNGFQVISSYFDFQDHQLGSTRQSISNFNSLVLADTPGSYLTLSITHEISQRSSSPAALATWTGLRPPLESLLLRPESPTSHAALPIDQGDTKASAVADVHDQDETNSRPMEIIVANILQALQQAKVDDLAKDIAQTALPESAAGETEGEPFELRALVYWPSEQQATVPCQRSNPDDLGIAVLPLNEFLDQVVLKESSDPEATVKSLGPKPNELSQPHPREAVRRHWLPLAESLIAVFIALGWPGPTRVGQFTSGKTRQRIKNETLS
jgi:hypothetical protein